MHTIERRSFLLLPAAALAQEEKPREIRLISAAPSPYTQRRDSYRAGHGILLNLRRLIEEHKLPLIATYYDASPLLGQAAKLKQLVPGAAVLMVGTSVWAQGPSSVSRTFFEAIDSESLAGVAASTWVTSGGAHTGAALAYESNLATLRSIGAAVFSFGQKQAVFTTDERVDVEKPGEFLLLDLWFMEGLAKAAIVNALALGNPARANGLWEQLESHPNYYMKHFPKNGAALETRFGLFRRQINGATNPRSEARRQLDAQLSQMR